jgi:hypothetical protein
MASYIYIWEERKCAGCDQSNTSNASSFKAMQISVLIQERFAVKSGYIDLSTLYE